MTPVTRHRPCTVERVARAAVLSDCGTYRYVLTRRWAEGPVLGWVMLNPSRADAERDDATVRRCMGFARSWGFAGIIVRNLYAARSSSPAGLWSHPEPVGPANDQYLASAAEDQLTVCAWGALGERHHRGRLVAARLDELGARMVCLGRTAAGQPRHPLYARAELLPAPFDGGLVVVGA